MEMTDGLFLTNWPEVGARSYSDCQSCFPRSCFFQKWIVYEPMDSNNEWCHGCPKRMDSCAMKSCPHFDPERMYIFYKSWYDPEARTIKTWTCFCMLMIDAPFPQSISLNQASKINKIELKLDSCRTHLCKTTAWSFRVQPSSRVRLAVGTSARSRNPKDDSSFPTVKFPPGYPAVRPDEGRKWSGTRKSRFFRHAVDEEKVSVARFFEIQWALNVDLMQG